MRAIPTCLPEVLILEPKVFGDERGFFFESFNWKSFSDEVGTPVDFVQDNHSRSAKGVLRGLHYQIQHAQGKLVRVISGAVFDAVVDVRKHSPNFGRWLGMELSEKNRLQVWIPPGFAHGFLALTESADIIYKTTDYWYPEHERCVKWDDPTIGINWPIEGKLILSQKDALGKGIAEAEVFE
jgi:dTDP-4-dehydrorhamnose 3,5-epimerase